MPQTEERQQRLQRIAKIAMAQEAQSGCRAALMVAQCAGGSKWGEKPVGENNGFGMKWADRHAKFRTVAIHETIRGQPVILHLEFADYTSVEDSCRYYATHITQGAPYRTAWERYRSDADLHALLGAVAESYSTSPQYAALVTALAGQKNVLPALAEARHRSQMQPPRQMLTSVLVRRLAAHLRSTSGCGHTSLPSCRKEAADEAPSQITEPAVEPSVADRPGGGHTRPATGPDTGTGRTPAECGPRRYRAASQRRRR